MSNVQRATLAAETTVLATIRVLLKLLCAQKLTTVQLAQEPPLLCARRVIIAQKALLKWCLARLATIVMALEIHSLRRLTAQLDTTVQVVPLQLI